MSKTNYNVLDITKFLLSLLIICAHTVSEVVELPPAIDRIFSLYIIAVPFFFASSAFLFFRKVEMATTSSERWERYKHYSKRIWQMYLAWSLIYFCFICGKWYLEETPFIKICQYFYCALVYTTYSTIWFLPALWVAVSITFYLKYIRSWDIKFILYLSAFLYIIGGLEYTYHELNPIMQTINDVFIRIFISWRNGVFNGFIFTVIGYIIAKKDFKKISLRVSLFGSSFFLLAFVAEAFLMKKFVPQSDANFIFMLVPFTYFFLILVCQIKISDSKLWIWLRNLSLLTFVSQRLFLSAIPSVFHSAKIWEISSNPYIGLLSVILSTVSISVFIILLSKKYSIFRYLM